MRVYRFSILILLVTAAVPAFAQSPLPVPPPMAHDTVMYLGNTVGFAMGGGGEVPEAVVERVKAALALSDTQVNAMRALLTIRSQTNAEVFKELQEKQQAWQELQNQSNPSPTDLGNAFLATRRVQEKLQAASVKFRTDFTAILSAAQRATLTNIQSASEQIEALTMVGLLEGSRGTFTMAMPAMGSAPLGGAVRIERRAPVVQ